MKKDTTQNNNGKTSEAAKNQTPFRTPFSKPKGIPLVTSETEDEILQERREAYVEPQTRQILRNLIESGKEGEVLPFYHPASGFTYELKATQNGNAPHKISRDFLENLVRLDILQKSFHDSISTCSKCESPAITLHNRCPKCKTHHVDKISLTEHIPCGYIDQKDKYINNVCPKCGKLLVEGEYRSMGRWYVCKECGERFEHSQFDVICRDCNTNFKIEEAAVLEIPKFTLNPKRTKEIRQNVASLENISKLLTDLGFKIEMPGTITGQKSGMTYHFSLIAKKQTGDKETVIAVDHEVAEDEVHTSPLILYIYKTSEMKLDLPIFIAIPKLSENAKKIAKGHEILVIEGSPEGQERIDQIKAEIESRLRQTEVSIIEPETVTEATSVSKEEKPTTVSSTPPAIPLTKQIGTPLTGMLRKLKFPKIIENPSTEKPISTEKSASSQISTRNFFYLLDGSSSMRKGKGTLSNFDVAAKAIENILINPDQNAKDDVLSLIVFWDETIKGFQKEVICENQSMGAYIDPQKLNQFGQPKRNVGTPLWPAVHYAIDYLKNKKGDKIIKLITDAVDFPAQKGYATISRLQENAIKLDLIVVGSENNLKLQEEVKNADMGRYFESSEVESLIQALRA